MYVITERRRGRTTQRFVHPSKIHGTPEWKAHQIVAVDRHNAGVFEAQDSASITEFHHAWVYSTQRKGQGHISAYAGHLKPGQLVGVVEEKYRDLAGALMRVVRVDSVPSAPYSEAEGRRVTRAQVTWPERVQCSVCPIRHLNPFITWCAERDAPVCMRCWQNNLD